MGNASKAAFLGMSFGTASGRLRKQILFKYVRMAGDHFCFKCGKEIESVDDLSIEHKEPWQNRSVEAFWDLDNIAFSHLKCNVPHERRGTPRIESADGMGWCGRCKQELPLSAFGRDSQRRTGYHHYCRVCHGKTK